MGQIPSKDERRIVRRATFRDKGYLAGTGAGLAGSGVGLGALAHTARTGKFSRKHLAAIAAGEVVGTTGTVVGLRRAHKVQNEARTKAGYPERTFWFGRQKKPVAKAGLGLMAKPWTANRFKAAGRLTRIKSADTAVRSAGYLGRNATPLVAGATVGGGLSYMATRKKDPMSKGLPSALRPVAREMKAIRAGAPVAGRRARPGSSSYNTYINNRVSANVHGRMAGRAGLVRVGDGSVARIGGKDKLSPKGQPRLIGGSKGKNVAAEVYLGSQNARAARYMGAGFSPSRRPLRNV